MARLGKWFRLLSRNFASALPVACASILATAVPRPFHFILHVLVLSRLGRSHQGYPAGPAPSQNSLSRRSDRIGERGVGAAADLSGISPSTRPQPDPSVQSKQSRWGSDRRRIEKGLFGELANRGPGCFHDWGPAPSSRRRANRSITHQRARPRGPFVASGQRNNRGSIGS